MFAAMKEKLQQLRFFLMQGTHPQALAMGISIGVVCGVFPVMGTTSLFVALVAWIFRVNQVFAQLVHWLISPLQLVLLWPFFKYGQIWFGGNGQPLSFDYLKSRWNEGVFMALKTFAEAHLQAVLAWLVVGLPVAVLIYFVSLFLLRRRNRATV